MHSNTAETPKITIDEYPRMQTGGWIAMVLGLGGLLVLLTAQFTTRVVLPTGLASLTMGLGTGGCVLLVGRLVLMKLDEHKFDHERSAIDVEDISIIKSQVADILVLLARMDVERQEERRVVTQVEEFMAWRADAVRRLTQSAERAAADPSVNSQRDAAWLADMAEALEIGREIERRRPPEE